MKIAVIDSWGFKFTRPVIVRWQRDGHDIRAAAHWSPDLVEWADVVWFYPVDNNLKRASREPKPPNTCIVAEAVDIDIYAGHPGGVHWDFVDALIVMAPHILTLLQSKTKLPDDLPIHIIPGGVDLDRFTLRKQPLGYNIAWIGRLWVAKNVFGALQIFNQLLRASPASPNVPWKLHCLGKGWDPLWWKSHVMAYLEANPALAERVEFVNHVPDVNEWLEDKAFLLQTSFKEAFGYVVAEAAAKGIQPIIQNTNGALDTWPWEWIFNTHAEAVEMIAHKARDVLREDISGYHTSDYDPERVRAVIAERYPLEARVKALSKVMGI